MTGNRRFLLLGILLSFITIGLFFQIGDHDFINMDDPFFIEAHHVPEGLTWANIKRAFTMTDCLWFPMTWLSHMADSQLYQGNPAGHHYTSLIIHLLNLWLLLFVLWKLTGQLWPSTLAALLLAIHPLNVESVAYISARNGLLAAFFWLATMAAYYYYTQHRTTGRYLLTGLLFLLGTMAKPSIIALPPALFLLDYWPLDRFSREPWRRLVLEKVPFFILAALIGLLAVATQQQAGTLLPAETAGLPLRLGNALVSYLLYLKKTFYPLDLAIFYPFPRQIPAGLIWLAGGGLAVITAAAYGLRRGRPYLWMGWLWFLLTLVPAIGLIKTGQQAMADRYGYIPLIGLFIIISWGLNELRSQTRLRNLAGHTGLLAAILLLLIVSWHQIGHWKNSQTVFGRALEVTRGNYLAYNNLGQALAQNGRQAAAEKAFGRALEIIPNFGQAHYNLGRLRFEQGDTAAARRHFQAALQAKPDFHAAHYYLGQALMRQDKLDRAGAHFQKTLATPPDPKSFKARSHNALGTIRVKQEDIPAGRHHFEQALALDPDLALAHNNLGQVLMMAGEREKAKHHFQKALSLVPGQLEPANRLARIYKQNRQFDQAIALYKTLLIDRPDCSVAICYNLAALYARAGDKTNALKWLRQSLANGFSHFQFLQNDTDFQSLRKTPEYQALIKEMTS